MPRGGPSRALSWLNVTHWHIIVVIMTEAGHTRYGLTMASDIVLGVFPREQLSDALIAVHRAGFGPQARVLDSARGPLAEQLRKLGQRVSLDLGPDEAGSVVVVIGAPGRAERALATLRQAGARIVVSGGQPVLAAPPPGVDEPAAVPFVEPPPAELH